MNDEKVWVGSGCGALVLLLGVIGLSAWGCPRYEVYQKGLKGEAALRESESSRKILVEEAKAKKEAAKLLAEAEAERAKGVAEANRIIGDSLKENNEYLIWLWIDKVSDNNNSIIYIPTESGLPVLEAGRGVRPFQPKPKEPK